MPRTLIMTAAGLAILAAVSIARADDSTTASSGTGTGDQSAAQSSLDDPAAVVPAGPALSAGSASSDVTYGVFRENSPDIPVSQRNCWSQATLDGQTSRGEPIAQGMTSTQAQCVLNMVTRRGLCASDRTASTWSTRHENGADNWAGGTSTTTDGNLDVATWNWSHSGPGRPPRGHHSWSGDGTDSGSTDAATDGTSGGDGSSDSTSAINPAASAASRIYWITMGCTTGDGGHRHAQR